MTLPIALCMLVLAVASFTTAALWQGAERRALLWERRYTRRAGR